VGVARALAADPPVLLMDEPFGAVDPVVRTQLQDELLRLQQELGKTIVFVTHDIDEAVRLGDRIAVFRTGGHLVQCATPAELLARPADEFVADFLGAERGLKLLSLSTLADVPQSPAPEGGRWELVLDTARTPLGWLDRDAGESETLVPVRPLRDGDSLLSALNESVASPTGLVARVDAAGALTGVTPRDVIHAHAGDWHASASNSATAGASASDTAAGNGALGTASTVTPNGGTS
jgi:osmoprotectant transport system ATP-binding protein